MSLTKASFSMVNGAPISVLDYGADPTGVADSAAAFQAAADAGLNIYIPEGNYKLASGITIQAGSNLFGDGPIAAFITFTGTGTAITCTAGEYTYFRGFSLYGNPTSPAYFDAGTRGIEINDSISMMDVHVRYFERAVNQGSGGFYNKFYNCHFQFVKYGVYGITANNATFVSCKFAFSQSHVVLGGYDAPVSFVGCSFENCVNNCVGLINGCQPEVTFNGCYFENVPTADTTGTGLTGTFTAAFIAYGDFKAASLFGCGIQIMGFQRGLSTTYSGATLVGQGNIWYYKLDGGVSDTQCFYYGGGHLAVDDKAEAWSVPSYTPATTYTPIGVIAASLTTGNGFDPISGLGIAATTRFKYDSAAPVSGTWAVGDIVYNTTPTAGGNIGWVCTTAGTPGTWKTFGAIAA